MVRGPYKTSKDKIRKLEMILRRIDFISFDELVKIMDCSERMLYNYISDLRKKYGSILETENKPKYSYRIYDPLNTISQGLTDQEFNSLLDVLESNGSSDKLRSKVLGILSNARWMNLYFDDKIKIINKCIIMKKMIHIKIYYPRDKTLLKDVHLNPVHFDEANGRIRAFYQGDNNQFVRTFNLENMHGLHISHFNLIKIPYKIDPIIKKDPFGFTLNKNKEEFDLRVLLKPFAFSQLFRQFPKMIKYIKKLDESQSPYLYELKITVFDIEPIGRFLTGLLNEIKILGTEHSKKEIREKYIKSRVFEGYKDNFNLSLIEK